MTADYSLQPDGTIIVTKIVAGKPQGRTEARGRAKVVDRLTNAKLKVSFFGPFYGDYWVLDHADDYNWSIVGEPSGRYSSILAREPTPSEATVNGLIHSEQAALVMTPRCCCGPSSHSRCAYTSGSSLQ